MNKIPTVFERDWDNDRSRVTEQVHPGCEWVLDGEGNALRKWDGTCVMFDGEEWWARREVKAGKEAPAGFRSVEHDHVTLAAIGWQPIEDSPFAKFHAQALAEYYDSDWAQGTYELCGPKVQGNPEHLGAHMLIRHDFTEGVGNLDRSFAGIRDFLAEAKWEGIVFHHPDGKMAKIKGRDFGLKRITAAAGREAIQ